MSERGASPIVFLVGLAIAIAFVFVACDALFEDDDEEGDLGMSAPAWVMDRGDGDDNRGGRNDNGRECEDTEDCSSFSPSFEDSPIIVCVQPDACRFG